MIARRINRNDLERYCSDTPNVDVRALSRFLSRCGKPFELDLRSPLFSKDIDRSDILDNWALQFDQLLKVRSLPDFVRDLENSEFPKCGPYSVKASYEDRVPLIEPYFKNKNPILERASNVDKDCWEYAFQKVLSFMPRRRLRPQSTLTSCLKLKKNTNWGWPFFLNGKESWESYLKYLDIYRYTIEFRTIFIFPSLLGWRGQCKNRVEVKNRIVFMYSHILTILEKCYVDPIVEILKERDEFIMMKGERHCAEVITSILNKARTSRSFVLGFDASAYDTSINKFLILEAFRIIKEWYQEDCGPEIDFIAMQFRSSDLLGEWELWYGRESSVPSGSCFTNILDSLVQLLLFHYTVKKSSSDPSDLDLASITVMGDDGVWLIKDIKLGFVIDLLSEHFGITLNPEKQYYSDITTSFCQKLYSLDYLDYFGICIGVRSLYRTLNGMISLEVFKPGFTPVDHSIRWIMQIENCYGHPFWEEFIDFVITGDVYGLGTKYPGGITAMFKYAGGISGYIERSPDSFILSQRVRQDTTISSLKTVNYMTKRL